MATLTKAESKKMYSWWWDSHISPKNSKWLQENLTDMDTKVKLMIKLIEVDEDSFARRAEMYYKKRPELMNLVEEFYRAFRALAERYDHATGVIKQAHKTMPEAFPNQLPDDFGPCTPEMSASVSIDGEEIRFSNAKKELNFDDAEKKALISQLDMMTENFEKLSERNTFLENTVLNTKGELETLKKASKNSEDSRQFLGDDKSILLKERQILELKLEEELVQVVSFQFEICILHSVMQDLRETNSSLVNMVEKIFETSKLSEELILELEYENIEQHEEVKFLSEQIKRLGLGMFQLLKALDVDLELVCEDNFETDQIILHHILAKLDDTRGSVCKVWDENQKLLVEKSVLETLLGQLIQEVSDLKSVIRTGNNQLSSLQKDMHKLLHSHEQLILRIEEGNHKEEIFVAEVVNLRKKLLEMQEVCQVLEKKKCGMIKVVARSDDENNKLEVDAVALGTLSLVFKNSAMERSEMINELVCNASKLCDDNGVLEDEVRIMANVVEKYQVESMNLKDTVQKFDDELKEVKTENSQLRLEIEWNKDQLSQEKDDHGRQIIGMSERYDQQLKESESLRESMQNAAAEVCKFLKEQKETDRTVEILHSELKKARVEAELWETVAGTFFSELQTCSIREDLFREKVYELSREYGCLEDENHSKYLEIMQLKEKVASSEGENSQINTSLTGNVQALAILSDSVASLESHATRTGSENEKDSASSHKPSKDVITAPTSDSISNLLDLAARIKAVETKVIKTKKLAEERNLKALRSQSSRSHRGSGRSSSQQKPISSSHDIGELLIKDIMLDRASEATSSCLKNRRGKNNIESDDPILELWETMDQTGSINLTVGRAHDPLVEKELDVDSMGPTESKSNRKILDRLESDVQKLANLQITVQDLKQKILITESSNPTKVKGTEYVRLTDQLNEAEKAVAKLLNVNGKLMKIAEESSEKRRVTERTRRCEEKIGRLELEMKNIQLKLVKLDGSSNKTRVRSGTRVAEKTTRIVLKDFLYPGRRKKKGCFCGCMHSPTSVD